MSAIVWNNKTLVTRETARSVLESIQAMTSMPGWAIVCDVMQKESEARRKLAGSHTINQDDARQIFSHNQNVLCADTLDAIQRLPEAIVQQGEDLLKKTDRRQA